MLATGSRIACVVELWDRIIHFGAELWSRIHCVGVHCMLCCLSVHWLPRSASWRYNQSATLKDLSVSDPPPYSTMIPFLNFSDNFSRTHLIFLPYLSPVVFFRKVATTIATAALDIGDFQFWTERCVTEGPHALILQYLDFIVLSVSGADLACEVTMVRPPVVRALTAGSRWLSKPQKAKRYAPAQANTSTCDLPGSRMSRI